MPDKLQVRDLRFRYEDKEIFAGLSFCVREGEFVSLLGPSGCGKSTVLNLLAGIIRPDSGALLIDGVPFHGITEHFAYMPQNDLLLPWKTILENVCLYGKIHGSEAAAREQALPLFPAFGLSGYENAHPDTLSGGMRQRAAFLRTALCGADVLLLDEPFGALDVITRGDMQDWLITMRSKIDRTALLVTHDIDEAIYLSDRILIMGESPARIVQEIPVREQNKSRDWLYAQSKLRAQIHTYIKGMAHGTAI